MGNFRASRCLDLVGSITGLFLSFPILVAAAAAIKLADRGPVFYKQERIGQHGRPFVIYKLRTMTVNAEHNGLGLLIAENDSRITKPGRILRSSSIDELPQLINVLRGDMSLVGPRPTVASQVERYTSHQRRRLEVKPGVTGWAQVNGRNTLSWPERIDMDVWYVDNKSFWLDLVIIARTPRSLLDGASVYGPSGLNRGL
jgi:lipopolysaccharide/colanic/teichoic acid biosynthesis glycosyltransferase